ncbi:DHA2 family multidrug resistance protein-like MFS transporter [Allocatelliglobosispora scoriae]|uniref:DHA2 family multidrug resistance protein-like MFS transporter n=1 Tax=Allocatelliglobosispora scoriae TaxID=643052 RepID=A0A841BRN4_9ACTN|nr:MFS transporter [Allocatelliglobosispora scoriae]MBB5870058.1 DHA2 family multidrug resistance protein-like MFS transporter [Allocatelliglobosispora scoriae]
MSRDDRRAYLALAVLALPTMLIFLDITVLYLALPHLSADLGASGTQQLWITDSYAFLMAGSLITMGRIGDRFGRRRVLLWGAGTFGVASLLAAFAPSPELLIVARGVLGVAGAAILPSTLALITTLFRDSRRLSTAIALWTTAMMAGVAFGPVIGGVLISHLWWGAVFLIGLPVVGLLLATGPRLLPEVRGAGQDRLDPASVVLSLATILPAVWGLKELARAGWRPGPVVALMLGAAFALTFVRRQRRLRFPLLDLRLLASPLVSGALLIGLLVAGVQSGTSLLAVQHLQLVEGLSPARAGLWLLPPAIALVIGMNLTPLLARRVHPARILAGGAVIALIGQLVLTRVPATGSTGVVVCGLCVAYLGVSPVGPLVNGLVLANVPPGRSASAASLPSTGGELGVALGIAAMGSIAMLVYRRELHVPPGVSAGPVQEGLVAAGSVAGGLPGPAALELLTAAREAFTASLTVVSAVNALICAAIAVLALKMLHTPYPSEHAARQDRRNS